MWTAPINTEWSLTQAKVDLDFYDTFPRLFPWVEEAPTIWAIPKPYGLAKLSYDNFKWHFFKKIALPKEKVVLERELKIELRCFPVCETWLRRLREPGQSDLIGLAVLELSCAGKKLLHCELWRSLGTHRISCLSKAELRTLYNATWFFSLSEASKLFWYFYGQSYFG